MIVDTVHEPSSPHHHRSRPQVLLFTAGAAGADGRHARAVEPHPRASAHAGRRALRRWLRGRVRGSAVAKLFSGGDAALAILLRDTTRLGALRPPRTTPRRTCFDRAGGAARSVPRREGPSPLCKVSIRDALRHTTFIRKRIPSGTDAGPHVRHLPDSLIQCSPRTRRYHTSAKVSGDW